MAVYRPVQVSFWQDAKVIEEMTQKTNYLIFTFLQIHALRKLEYIKLRKSKWLLILGYSMESVNALLDRFENHHKLVKYNAEHAN